MYNVFHHAILECRKSFFVEKINGLTFHKINDVISEKNAFILKKNDNNTDTLISGTQLDI